MNIHLISQNHISTYKGGNEAYVDSLSQSYQSLGHSLNFASPPDIIHFSGTWIKFIFWAVLAKFKSIPTVWTFQAPCKYPAYDWLMSKLVTTTITTSKYSKKYLQALNPSGRYQVIPLTLPYPITKPKLTKLELRKQLNLDSKIKYVITIAKLDKHHYYKGINILIQALSQLPANYATIIIGGGDLLPKYQSQSPKRIIFTGEISEALKHQYLKAADIFVLPSLNHSEGFGLSVLEAAYHGLPCIITNCIGAVDYFQTNGIASIIPPNNPSALADAIINICRGGVTPPETNPGSRKDLFDPITMAQATLKIYEHLIS
jgi:glycosyltransferase involved in cell wall biosynthesis